MSLEHRRADELNRLLDPGSLALCAQLGVARGWTCLGIGPLCGSVTAELGRMVGPSGQVMTTDVDLALIRPTRAGQANPVRPEATDGRATPVRWQLVHARAMLEHLFAPSAVIHRWVDALAPGGWLLVEEIDLRAKSIEQAAARTTGTARAAFREVIGLGRQLSRGTGAQPDFCVVLPRALREAGLIKVASRVRSPLHPGGPTGFYALSLRRLTPAILEAGLGTEFECSRLLTQLSDHRLVFPAPPIVAVWGQHPWPA